MSLFYQLELIKPRAGLNWPLPLGVLHGKVHISGSEQSSATIEGNPEHGLVQTKKRTVSLVPI